MPFDFKHQERIHNLLEERTDIETLCLLKNLTGTKMTEL